MRNQKVLQMEGITKTFPGITALDKVDFDLYPGEVHVLLGENGAGKSTLIKVLTGFYTPNEGNIHIRCTRVDIRHPLDALALGIGTVHQEFSLIPQFSIAHNLYLGIEPVRRRFIDRKKIHQSARRILREEMGFDCSPTVKVRDLPVAEKQIIYKATFGMS